MTVGNRNPFGRFFDILKKSDARKPPNVAKPVVVKKLRCETRDVTAFLMSDGSISISVRLNDGKTYAAGQIVGGAFVKALGSLWNAELNKDILVVSQRGEKTLATCDLPRNCVSARQLGSDAVLMMVTSGRADEPDL